MVGLYSISIIIAVLAVGVSIWGARWMRVVMAIVLFLIALDLIAIDIHFNAPRKVAGTEIAQGAFSVSYLEGSAALHKELLPYMGALLIVCCGFLALGVSRKK